MEKGWGYRDHKIIAKAKAIIGNIEKRIGFLRVGLAHSLVNNFRASAKGWGRPKGPDLLGPLRIWKYPKHFRSNRVKKAIAIKGQIIEIRMEIIGAKVIIKEEKSYL